ncbi:MAG: gamma carbonic anhydrase family protein [Desulfobacterales bacterium RIFOXYA12_FULL_46_15]|nr:MAG: gamma carbonic anhydrase family protein [Desulfobacterales bacterium RIFOXYA12_FULL_46_15]
MTLYACRHFVPSLDATVFVAPTAQIIGNVHIDRLSSVWFHTVLRGDLDEIRIGERTNIQDLCMCHADVDIPLKIGNGVTIGHRCILHGCTVEDNCLIGMGAIVMNHAVIGEHSIIAAGTLVLEKTVIPPFSLVTGSPGKIKKTFQNREETENAIRAMSESYMENALVFGSAQLFYQIKD